MFALVRRCHPWISDGRWIPCFSRHLNLAVVFESSVQHGKDVVEGGWSPSFLEVIVLHQLPCNSLWTAQQVEHTLILAVAQFHLLGIDSDPLPPFTVVGRSTIEDRDVVVSGALVVVGIFRRRRSNSSRYRTLQKGPRRGEALQGAKGSKGSAKIKWSTAQNGLAK